MPTFIVNSAILRPSRDPKACATETPKVFLQLGTKDVKLQACYCCSDEGRVVFVMQGPNQDAILDTLNKLNVPVASIMEAEGIYQMPESTPLEPAAPKTTSKEQGPTISLPLFIGIGIAAVAAIAILTAITKKSKE